MPRQRRLDAPGLLQHVMARGIERREIFHDDKDRNSFLERLAIILEETQSQCYAWSLIPNHFHLLIRTGTTPLSKVMRRLMTGHAVTFNKRHKRSGHLFQNRYKSIICEEDPYLLELIRYIHLNPLRAKLVQDLKELDKYPWTGHSAILGRRKNLLIPEVSPPVSTSCAPRPKGWARSDFASLLENQNKPTKNPFAPFASSRFKDKLLAEKTIEDLLLHFGATHKVARRKYRQFVKSGIDQGKRPELQGGGLVRSSGGNKVGLLGRKKEEREKGDARILGGGDFVNEALRKAGEDWEKGKRKKMPLEQLIKAVASHFEVEEGDLKSSCKKKPVVEAKSAFGYLAIKKMAYSGREVGNFLNMRSYSAIRRAQEGKKVVDNREDIWDLSRIVE